MVARPGRVHSLEPPAEVQKFLASYGGSNLYGEPMFRLVWGGGRLVKKGGKWEGLERTVIEYREVPKYPHALERFVIEVWHPPQDFGTPDQWEFATSTWVDGQRIDAAGAYPSRGDYDFLDAVEVYGTCDCGKDIYAEQCPGPGEPLSPCPDCGQRSQFLTPTRAYCQEVVDHWRKARHYAEMKKQHSQLEAALEENRRRDADHYYDVIHDATPEYIGRPTVLPS